MGQISPSHALFLVLVLGLTLTGVVFEFDKIAPFGLVASVALGWLLLDGFKGQANVKKHKSKDEEINKVSFKHIYWDLLVGLLPFWFLVRLWGGEYPFSGDHDHQSAAVVKAAEFWQGYGWPALIIVGSAFYLTKQKRNAWLGIGFVGGVWIAASQITLPEFYFARYPAAFYFLTSPVQWFADAMGWANQINVLRLTNFLALPLGFVFLRRLSGLGPMSLASFAFAVFLFWQKDVLYYVNASYLEPWSLVLVALALEVQVKSSEVKPWLPLGLVGLAACFKEQAILLWPFFWFMNYRTLTKESVLVGATTLPFIGYYFYRLQNNVWRQFKFDAGLLQTERLEQWGQRFFVQVGWSGIVVMLAVSAWTGYLLFSQKEVKIKKIVFFSVMAALVQFLFFFLDDTSKDWVGYPRFNLLLMAMLGVGLFYLPFEKFAKAKQIIFLITLGIMQLLAMPQALISMSLAEAKDSFTEHYDSPQYYPIRELFRKAESESAGALQRGIALNLPTPQFHPQAIQFGYREFVKKYRFMKTDGGCQCKGAAELVLVPVAVGLNQNKAASLAEEKKWQDCGEKLKTSCAKVFTSEISPGRVAGYLGVSP